MGPPAPWNGSFVVDGEAGGAIRLRQVGVNDFALESSVRYVGERTGLEGSVADRVIDEIRHVGPATLPVTDLTSVPQALRWFVSQYGTHTPAALIHDRLVDAEPPIEGLTDVHADRYFRVMLHDVGVRWIRRWLMWTAVALRTRSKAGGATLAGIVVWVLASLAGMGTAVAALLRGDWLLLAGAAVAPFLFAALWGRQYGAGLLGALAAPWLLPPTVVGMVGFWVYALLERLAGVFVDRDRTSPEPLRYESF